MDVFFLIVGLQGLDGGFAVVCFGSYEQQQCHSKRAIVVCENVTTEYYVIIEFKVFEVSIWQ